MGGNQLVYHKCQLNINTFNRKTRLIGDISYMRKFWQEKVWQTIQVKAFGEEKFSE